MREDMAKVIVERPRRGGGVRFPRGAGRHQGDFERLPRRQGINRPWTYGGDRKGLNENLAPLRRYLLSNVGRPWDRVFGDICERINVSSAVQLHIWQHVRDYVCLDAVRVEEGGNNRHVPKNGKSRKHRIRRGGYVDSRGRGIRKPFLVDPRSGLLMKNESSNQWRHP